MGIVSSFYYSYQNEEKSKFDHEQIIIRKLNDLEKEFKKKYNIHEIEDIKKKLQDEENELQKERNNLQEKKQNLKKKKAF